MIHESTNQTVQLFQTISQHCPKLKYLQIYLIEECLCDFKQILINCQLLEELSIYRVRKYLDPNVGERVLKTLIESAPLGLHKFHLGNYSIFEMRSLKEFFSNWYERKPMWLSIIEVCDQNDKNDLNNMIEHYKSVGIIERYENFHIDDCMLGKDYELGL